MLRTRMGGTRWTSARVGLAALMLVALAAGACGGDGDDSGEDGGAQAAIEYGGGGGGDAPETAGGSGSQAGDSAASAALEQGGGSGIPSVGESVIKTADLRIEVERDGLRAAVQRVEQTAPRYGGFVHSTGVEDSRSAEGVVVIRVPSEDFEVALRDVKAVGDVMAENVSGKDVSQEFVDLDARIRNLEAQEAVLLDLMEKATTISETINVQNNLSGIQLEIERLRGRLNFLEDRTSLGTISVALVEEGAPEPTAASTWSKAWNQAGDILEGLGAGSIIVVVGFILPFGVLFLIGFLIFKAVRPRFTSS